jgi:hypothetical protein
MAGGRLIAKPYQTRPGKEFRRLSGFRLALSGSPAIVESVKQTNPAPETTMKKTFSILSKVVVTLNLIVAVATGKNIDTAIVSFNSVWF